MSDKEQVDGIILILSCQKHIQTQLQKYRLPNSEYCNWKVINVVGDLFLEENYKLKEGFLYVKCEDSYIHLLKKLVLAIESLCEIYEIKQGVLRSGDDVVFNETNLLNFIKKENKPDFYGNGGAARSLINPNKEDLKKTKDDYFMVEYYLTHGEDFDNVFHNLKNVNIVNYVKRPFIDVGAAGNLYYISKKSCLTLINHMKKINYDIFHFDDFSKSYPYTIEDCAVSFILFFHGIGFIYDSTFVSADMKDFGCKIGVSTNEWH